MTAVHDKADIAVLGGGPGGYVAALVAAQRGARVVLVEKERVGGTCLNVGCIPTKVLTAATELLLQAKRAAEFGLAIPQAAVNLPALMAYKRKTVDQLVAGVEGLLKARRVTLIHGEAQLVKPDTLAIDDGKGGRQEVSAQRVILAPGSVTATPPIGGSNLPGVMAPILKDLKAEYAGRMDVEFIDVWKNPDPGKAYKIKMIPTQIFFDASGKELFRHVGFYGKEDILGKWKELGVEFKGKASAGIVRETPVAADTRPRESVCFMCDENVNPKTKTVVKGQSEQRVLCGPHCYFIYLSSIVGADPKGEEAKVSVTDWASGSLVAASTASYVYGMDAKGRATIKVFADKEGAAKEQQSSAGNLVTWEVLRGKELAARCAFCDRAVYPEDACVVKFGTARGYGCCTHCSMGVAARLKQDIEVEAKDGQTGEPIRVKTLDGQIASLEPATAIAWFGQKKGTDGNWVSAGCFKQAFFVNEASLQKWLEARPAMTGRQITIAQALADKMKLSPDQIAKACKLGECK